MTRSTTRATTRGTTYARGVENARERGVQCEGMIGNTNAVEGEDVSDARLSERGEGDEGEHGVREREGARAVREAKGESREGMSDEARSAALARVRDYDRDVNWRIRAVECVALEHARACDDMVTRARDDAEDALAALGSCARAFARARWRYAVRAVTRERRERESEARARSSRRRATKLETQLRRVERYVAVAADDFERVNARLEREAQDARDARESERLAREALALALSSRHARANTTASTSAIDDDDGRAAREASASGGSRLDVARANALALERALVPSRTRTVAETMNDMLAAWRAREPAIASRLEERFRERAS